LIGARLLAPEGRPTLYRLLNPDPWQVERSAASRVLWVRPSGRTGGKIGLSADTLVAVCGSLALVERCRATASDAGYADPNERAQVYVNADQWGTNRCCPYVELEFTTPRAAPPNEVLTVTWKLHRVAAPVSRAEVEALLVSQ
jgi:hypothetical protein